MNWFLGTETRKKSIRLSLEDAMKIANLSCPTTTYSDDGRAVCSECGGVSLCASPIIEQHAKDCPGLLRSETTRRLLIEALK
jgi:hypothetical protein